MRVEFSYFKYFLCFIVLISLLGCSRIKNTFSSVHVLCMSYDGGMLVYADADGKDNAKGYAGMTFSGSGNYYVSTSHFDTSSHILEDSTQYTNSKEYDNAEVLLNLKTGMQFTLMPDKLHGVAEIWKDKDGKPIPFVRLPVLCFKSFK